MPDADKLTIVQSLLCLFGDRYIHVDDEQALHDCKYRRDDLVAAYTAITAILNDYATRDYTTKEDQKTRDCA